MTARRLLALTDAWRLQLLLDPAKRSAVLENLRMTAPGLELIDWEGPSPAAGSTLIVAALDLSTAELLLKLKPTVRVVAVDYATSGWTATFGGQRRLLDRARAVPARWVRPPFRPSDVPEEMAGYLAPAIAEAARLERAS